MATIAVSQPTARAATVRDETVFMLGGLWMIVGLFLDGWSHQADKPETFFTPWHGLLYSGFGFIVVYAGWTAVRDAKSGTVTSVATDRLTVLGLALFGVGAGGDFAWHSLVGIEVDIEGLISPTHLALMVGGLLMATFPIRTARQRGDTEAAFPVLVSMTLSIGVLAFFLMYLMPWDATYAFTHAYVPESDISNLDVQTGMAGLLVTTALFMGAVLWVARQWRLPMGAATTTFTAVAFGVAALDGFDVRLPILAATLAGLVVDWLLADERPLPIVGLGGGLVLCGSFLALQHAEGGVGWSPSLWSGAVVFATLVGYGAGVFVGAGSQPSGRLT